MKKNVLTICCLFLFHLINAQGVGINTDNPTKSLDVNGTARVRILPLSSSTNDKTVVADGDGVLKLSLPEAKGIMRGYLSENFSTPAGTGTIHRIIGWNVIDNPNADFNSSTGEFIAPITGLYKVTISITLIENELAPNPVANFVLGVVDNATNKWITRFSLPKSYVTVDGDTGNSVTFIGLVQLTAGASCSFGCSGSATLISIASGNTGSGIGSFFEIQLIKN